MLYWNVILPKSAPRTVVSAMDIIISFVKWQFHLLYFNDIVIFAKSRD